MGTYFRQTARLVPFILTAILLAPSGGAAPTEELKTIPNSSRYERAIQSVLKRAGDILEGGPTNPIQIKLTAGRSAAGLPTSAHQALALKNVNRSLELTTQGGALLFEQENLKQSETMLREAIREYSDNPLALLLLGDLFAQKGSRGEAIHYYLTYLERMKTKDRNALASFLFNEREKNIASKHVTEQLRSYGFEPPKRKGLDFLSLFPSPKRGPLSIQKVIAAYVLPGLILIGIPFIVYRRISIEETSPDADRILYELYFVLILAYGLWLVHLISNLPPIAASLEWEVIGVLIGGVALVLITEWLRKLLAHERERRDPETIFCPHCSRSILKLAVVCPFCNREVSEERHSEAGGRRI